MMKGKIRGNTIVPLGERRQFRVGKINGMPATAKNIQYFSYDKTKKAYSFKLVEPKRNAGASRGKEPIWVADLIV